MPLPRPVEALWVELESVRSEVLKEAEGLSQGQADWKPGEKDWSVGEILHHLTIAEIATGKLTTKLTREAETAGAPAGFPADLAAFTPLPAVPLGPAEALDIGRDDAVGRLQRARDFHRAETGGQTAEPPTEFGSHQASAVFSASIA